MRLHSCSSPWFVGDEPAPWREWYAAHGAETTELFRQFKKLMELQLQFGRHGLNAEIMIRKPVHAPALNASSCSLKLKLDAYTQPWHGRANL
jgi:hypothetical protein